jgi:hypothetical protein
MFLQDIEEDPELRGQIDLYRNEDIIKQLESKLAGMDLDKEVVEEKPKSTVAGGKDDRRTVTAVRKTQEGKQIKEQSEAQRKKNQAIIKATLKEKNAEAKKATKNEARH